MEFTEKQIQDISKTLAVASYGVFETLEHPVSLEMLEDIKRAAVLDIKNGSIKKCSDTYDKLIKNK